MAVMWRYELRAGAPATPPLAWPEESQLARVAGRPTLVMIAHPRCPCSRASVGELANLMAHIGDRVTAHVLLVTPEAAPGDWSRTDLRESAAGIPGVRVTDDVDGAEAHRFGALTSGQVVLYSATGRLVFSGGITSSRGHAGDNDGRDAIVGLLTHEPTPASGAAVFGCALFGPAS